MPLRTHACKKDSPREALPNGELGPEVICQAGYHPTPSVLLILLQENFAADGPIHLYEFLINHPVGAELRLSNLRLQPAQHFGIPDRENNLTPAHNFRGRFLRCLRHPVILRSRRPASNREKPAVPGVGIGMLDSSPSVGCVRRAFALFPGRPHHLQFLADHLRIRQRTTEHGAGLR